MATDKSLQVQEKKELTTKEEQTVPARFYVPYTDIYETDAALWVSMEMPGVEKDKVNIKLQKNILSIEGLIDFTKYEKLKPLYTEYNIGHYRRDFRLSSEIDSQSISAKLDNGVLTVELPKSQETMPRRISVV
ncbi:MAG: Hsp20/alpha crystallin family protein [Gammaproteobacteria bacterium]|jgi:HSP20 family molecular chaperone IbpA